MNKKLTYTSTIWVSLISLSSRTSAAIVPPLKCTQLLGTIHFVSNGTDTNPAVPLHPLIQTVAHAAFRVESIDEAIAGQTVILELIILLRALGFAMIEMAGALIKPIYPKSKSGLDPIKIQKFGYLSRR